MSFNNYQRNGLIQIANERIEELCNRVVATNFGIQNLALISKAVSNMYILKQ
jgi:hypothetical protein